MTTNLRHSSDLLTVKEAATLAGVSRHTIRVWIRRGRLGVLVLPSGRVRIPASRLLRDPDERKD